MIDPSKVKALADHWFNEGKGTAAMADHAAQTRQFGEAAKLRAVSDVFNGCAAELMKLIDPPPPRES